MFPLRPLFGGLLLVLLPVSVSVAAPAKQNPAAPACIEHKVLRGETMWSISQKHRTSVGAIMDYNHLPNHNVREGMVLRIPPEVVEPQAQKRQHIHVVKRGETFWSIADAYDLSPAMLAEANPNINPNRVHEDMEIIVPAGPEGDASQNTPDKPAPGPTTLVQHTVGENETFYSIGKRYGVTTEAMVAANPAIKPERLRSGMKVSVPQKNTAQTKTTRPASTTAKFRTHTVREGESIASIAKKHGITEQALLKANNLDEDDAIFVDDTLKLPTGTAPASSTTLASSKPAKTTTPSVDPQTKPLPPSPQKNTPPNTVGDDGAIRSYLVSAGEDENTICDAFGISKKQLYDYNRLAANTKLKPGDEIAIPRVSKGQKR